MRHAEILGNALAQGEISDEYADELATILMTPMSAVVMGMRQEHIFRVTKFHGEQPPSSRENVGPPPAELATLGRLNQAGQPMVYAASQSSLALVEAARSPGWYAIAEFKLRPDVGRFEVLTIGYPLVAELLQPSIAEAKAIKEKLGTAQYMEMCTRKHALQWLLTQPQPEQQSWAYKVTSRIADELRQKAPHDAIVYGTARPFSHVNPAAANLAMTPDVWTEKFSLVHVHGYKVEEAEFLGPFDPNLLEQAAHVDDERIEWAAQFVEKFS